MDFEYSTTGNRKKDLKENKIELISIAGVFVDEKFNIIKEYHRLVKPSTQNRILSEYCKELTKITDEDILEAKDFKTVVEEFCSIVNQYDSNELKFYTWGSFDEMALRKSVKLNSYKGEFKKIIRKIKNIQPEVSKKIKYNNKIYKSDWGLQKIKYILGMEISETHHEALSDAKDLAKIYMAYKKDIKPIQSRLEEIIENENKNKLKSINKNIKIKESNMNKKIENIYNSIESYSFNELEKPLIGYFKQFHNQVNFYEFNNVKLIFHKNSISLKTDNTSNEYNVGAINKEYSNKNYISNKDIGLSINSYSKNDNKYIRIKLFFYSNKIQKNISKEPKFNLTYVISINNKTKNSIKSFIKNIKDYQNKC